MLQIDNSLIRIRKYIMGNASGGGSISNRTQSRLNDLKEIKDYIRTLEETVELNMTSCEGCGSRMLHLQGYDDCCKDCL